MGYTFSTVVLSSLSATELETIILAAEKDRGLPGMPGYVTYIDNIYKKGRAFKTIGDMNIANRTVEFQQALDALGIIDERIQILNQLLKSSTNCKIFQHTISCAHHPVMHLIVHHPQKAWFAGNVRTSFHFPIGYTFYGLMQKNNGALRKTQIPLSILLHSYAMRIHGSEAICCLPLSSMSNIFGSPTVSPYIDKIIELQDLQKEHPTIRGFFKPDDLRSQSDIAREITRHRLNVDKDDGRCWPVNGWFGFLLTVVKVKPSFRKLWLDV